MRKWDKKTVYRRIEVDGPGNLDTEARTVPSILATGALIDGPFGRERLVMTPDAVDMERAAQGLPWHDDHGSGGTGERIGIVQDVTLGNGRLTGTLRASRNEGGERALKDIEDRIITHVSIGYRILDARFDDDTLVVTRWQPLEVSTPSVVADIHSTIQRNLPMPDPTVTPNPVPDPDAIAAAAAQRVTEIDGIFSGFPDASDLRARAFQEGWDVVRSRTELLGWLEGRYKPVGRGVDAVAGEDVMEKCVRGLSEAIRVRVQHPKLVEDAEAIRIRRENPYVGFSLAEMAREYLRVAGDPVRGDVKAVVGQAFTRAGIISHGTSDYANVLVDAANKAAQMAYEQAPETFGPWTMPGELPDFKTGHRPQLSGFEDLELVGENGEFKYGTLPDRKETIALASYGKLFSITRQAIINDDLAMFTRIPASMTRAALRKVGDLVYAILSTNGNMSDGNALFSAAHANYVAAGAGGAPTVPLLNAAYTAMATQTDGNSNVLNIIPRYILAPHALRGTIDALLASQLNPAEGSTTSFAEANIWRARLEPIYDARIDNDDAAKWYLVADPMAGETVEVAYLNGVQAPRLEQEDGFTRDGVTMKVAHDVGVSPLDWRFMYHNDGN